MKRFSCLVLGIFLLALWPAQADEPDDEYLRIFGLIEQADSLNNGGKAGAALAKYQEAQTALANFQKSHRNWNAKVISYRANYLAEKIAALSQKDSTPGATETSAAQVKLLDAGTEPRKILRLHPKTGDKQTVDMTVKIAIDVKIGEMENPAMKLPAMKMTLNLTVKDVSAAGDITYEMAVSDASVAEEPDVMPQLAEAMKASLASIKGMSGTGTRSSRGLTKSMDIKAATEADPQLRQAMEQMKEAFTRAATPLPEEAVGPGARWEARMPLKSQGMTIDQTATYELVSIEGERVTASSTIAQSAANQKIQNPVMPALKLDLTKMTGNGNGKITLDLSQLLPQEATVELHSESSMAMNAGDQKQTMTLKTEMNVRLEAK